MNETNPAVSTHTELKIPMSNGAFYKIMAVLLAGGFLAIVGLGSAYNFGEFGIFEGSNAFWVGGLILLLLVGALVAVLWNLSVTVHRTRQHLLQAMMLHEIIEHNYAKLQSGTDDLREEVKELRVLLAQAKAALQKQLAGRRA